MMRRVALALSLLALAAVLAGSAAGAGRLERHAVLRKGRSVVVTYTTLPAFAKRYAAMFASSAATIRLSGA